MTIEEVDVIIDYFHGSTPEHLDLLGVDPRSEIRDVVTRELQGWM